MLLAKSVRYSVEGNNSLKTFSEKEGRFYFFEGAVSHIGRREMLLSPSNLISASKAFH